MQIFPQDFQIRHQIKITDPQEFDTQLRERLEKIASESIISDDKKIKGKWYNKTIVDLIHIRFI